MTNNYRNATSEPLIGDRIISKDLEGFGTIFGDNDNPDFKDSLLYSLMLAREE